MDPKKRSRRSYVAKGAALAAMAITVTPVIGGCSSNALPPIPVPRADERAELPRWYPEAPWTAKDGQSRVYIEGKIVFDVDRAVIHPGSEKVLSTLLQFMTQHDEVTLFRVEGHTDSMASEEHNQELSARRALAVCDWLVDHGIDNTRLLAVGFGKSKPMAPNDRADGRQENRRTEFHVAEVNGRPFLQGSKDPTKGSVVLIVKSADERKREKEIAAMPKVVAKKKDFVPTGDEIKSIGGGSGPNLTPRAKNGS